MKTAQEMKTTVAAKLDELCKLMDEAQEMGLKVEFQLGIDQHGHNVVGRYDVWQRVQAQ